MPEHAGWGVYPIFAIASPIIAVVIGLCAPRIQANHIAGRQRNRLRDIILRARPTLLESTSTEQRVKKELKRMCIELIDSLQAHSSHLTYAQTTRIKETIDLAVYRQQAHQLPTTPIKDLAELTLFRLEAIEWLNIPPRP